MEVFYAPTFIRQLKALPIGLQEEVFEKVALFKHKDNHRQLKVHKLKGRLAGRYSLSVNYKTRVVFMYLPKDSAALLVVGDHTVYNQ